MAEATGRHSARQVFSHPVYLLAYGLGSGLSPWAPGTAGTVLGVAVYFLLRPLPLAAYLLITLALFAAGVFLCGYTAARLGMADPAAVNWDELVGYLVTMAFAPRAWPWAVAGFLLFRLLDIWKPWPIRWCDRRIKGGLGIMLDDAVAGVMAAALLYVGGRLAGIG